MESHTLKCEKLASHRLPERFRPILKRPLGILVKNEHLNVSSIEKELNGCFLLVSVGDATTEKLLSLGFRPDVEVVDSVEMRVPRSLPSSHYNTELRVSNEAGHLTDEAIYSVSNALYAKKPVRIIVFGEEDLLALPILATYPNDSVVAYGQPNSGMVMVRINDNLRKSTASILNEMDIVLG